MELTNLSLRAKRLESYEELKTRFAEYYALVKMLDNVNFIELEKYLSDDMKAISGFNQDIDELVEEAKN